MADHMVVANNIYQWNIIFIVPVHDWELEMATSFFNLLYSIRLNRRGRGLNLLAPPHQKADIRG